MIVLSWQSRIIHSIRVGPVAEMQKYIRMVLLHFYKHGIISEIFTAGTEGKSKIRRGVGFWKGFEGASLFTISITN